MELPKNIILSRKGFDSGTGCVPSPIFSDGNMMSLPIPDKAGTISYRDMSIDGHSIGNVVTDLGAMRRCRVGNKKITITLEQDDHAHLDPDLMAEARGRKEGWRPAYGQCGKDATILGNHGVGIGDLFLFFGWFRQCEKRDGAYRFVRGAPDIHVIFGYLRVGQIIRPSIDAVPDWLHDHPHLHGTARKSDVGNTIFVAADRLGLPDGEDLPGAAAFDMFTDELQLTWPGMTRSHWRLPSWFYPEAERPPLSSHAKPDRWRKEGDFCCLRSVARGQEFVLAVEHYPRAIEWAVNLIRHGCGHSIG